MKIVLIMSGGLDSSTLLGKLVSDGHEVKALGIDYGQRHSKELQAARQICAHYGIQFDIADLRSLKGLLAGSSQTSDDIAVPEGHYAEESMKLTVVPNRNMIMLSVAIGHAISLKYDAVAYGAHSGDHAIYPDCREEFATAVAECAQLADWHVVEMMRPFIGISKTDIARLSYQLGVPVQLTWSCYKGGAKHCGKCGTCVERIEAFRDADVPDPTEYE